jgi:hypothetical protein
MAVPEEKSPSKTALSFLPALFFVLNIFLFLPVAVYQGNVEEFSVSLKSILLQFLLPAAILLAVLTATGLLLRSGGRRRLASVVFVAAVLVWIQGNLLVWKYGVFSGKDIEWRKFGLPGTVDSVLWIVGIALAVIFWKKVSRLAAFGSIVFIVLQLVSGVFTGVRNPDAWKAYAGGTRDRTAPPGLFAFSAKQNVIQIVLDGFQSDFFREFLAQEPDRYGKILDGFTWFEEATGSFPSTQMSVPAFLSGQVYRNTIPTREFIKQINRGLTIGNILQDEGFEVDLVTGGVYTAHVTSTHSYQIDVPYGVTPAQYDRINGARMFDLALFRGAPQPLKRIINNSQQWVFRRMFGREAGKLEFTLFSHRAFLDDLIAKMTVSRQKPVYKYLHLMTMHPPILVDARGDFTPGAILNWNNRTAQARYAFDQILSLLEKLKSAGIYDSSLIILQADHGSDEGIPLLNNDDNWIQHNLPQKPSIIASLALPLLAVKPPNARGAFKESKAPVALTDIPATVMSFLGVKQSTDGRNVFDVAPDEKRDRRFIYYNWSKTNWENEYFEDLNEYSITGNPRDWNSWRWIGLLRPPEVSFETDTVEFGTRQSNRYKRSGWSPNEKDPVDRVPVNWALGGSASLNLAFPKDQAMTLTAVIKSHPFGSPQIVTVQVDHRTVGKWVLDAPWAAGEYSVVIPPKSTRPDKSFVEFLFSQNLAPSSPLGARAVQFRTITLR